MNQWISISAVISALVSVVFGVLSWVAKREIARRDKDLEEMKTLIKDLAERLRQTKETCAERYITKSEYDRSEQLRVKQMDGLERQNERLENHLLKILQTRRNNVTR